MATLKHLSPFLERYELKYLIPYEYIDPVSNYLSIYCSLDHYSEIAKENNYFYKVSSLYLDTPHFEFLRQRIEGKDIRFNMRVRVYGEKGEGPYYLEIKNRRGVLGVVKKYRATADESDWPTILTEPGYRVSEENNKTEKDNKELFLRLANSYAVEPKILTSYMRRAFFSTIDNYARATLDVNMQYRIEHDYNLCSSYGMCNYDNETIYANNTRSEASVILELKCNVGEVPCWMIDLIKQFNLQQVGFSKYVNSSLTSSRDNGYHYMLSDHEPGYSFD